MADKKGAGRRASLLQQFVWMFFISLLPMLIILNIVSPLPEVETKIIEVRPCHFWKGYRFHPNRSRVVSATVHYLDCNRFILRTNEITITHNGKPIIFTSKVDAEWIIAAIDKTLYNFHEPADYGYMSTYGYKVDGKKYTILKSRKYVSHLNGFNTKHIYSGRTYGSGSRGRYNKNGVYKYEKYSDAPCSKDFNYRTLKRKSGPSRC